MWDFFSINVHISVHEIVKNKLRSEPTWSLQTQIFFNIKNTISTVVYTAWSCAAMIRVQVWQISKPGQLIGDPPELASETSRFKQRQDKE